MLFPMKSAIIYVNIKIDINAPCFFLSINVYRNVYMNVLGLQNNINDNINEKTPYVNIYV